MSKSFFYAGLLICLFTGSCDKPNDQTVPPGDIITLKAVSDITALNADGNTVIQFTATIPTTTAMDTKSVLFTLSDVNAGKFTGTSTNGAQTINSNSDGVATCNIKLGTVPGVYYLTAATTFGGVTYNSAQVTITLNALSNAQKIQLTADNSSPVADAFSTIKLSLVSTFSQDKKVVLTSNTGSFVNSTDPKTITVILDGQGNGSTQYRITNEVTPNIITATLTDGSFTTINFTPVNSYADYIIGEPSAGKIDLTGGSVQVTTALKKNDPNYKVSKNSPIYFNAYQTIGGVRKDGLGRFIGTTQAVTDASGNVPVVTFFADTGNFDATQPIYIELKAYKSANVFLPAQLFILTVKS